MRFFCLMCVLFLCQCKGREWHSGREGNPIPGFNILFLDSTTVVNTKKMHESSSVVLFFFDPYCPYCKVQTETILNNINKFKGVQFCFFSVSPMDDVRAFYKNFNLQNYSNIYVGIDTGFYYMNYFNISTVPHTSIYPKGQPLVKVFPSEAKIEQLLESLNMK